MNQNFYKIGQNLLKSYFKLALKVDINLNCDIPKGPKIFIANHPTTTDPFLLAAMINEQVSMLIWEKLFEIPVLGSILKKIQYIPVNKEYGYLAMNKAQEMLMEKKSIMIFPEGVLSPSSSNVQPFHTGAVRLSIFNQIPIIPIGISLLDEKIIVKRTKIKKEITNAKFYLHGPYSITIGHPIKLKGNIENKQYVRKTSDNIRNIVQNLVEQSRSRIQHLY